MSSANRLRFARVYVKGRPRLRFRTMISRSLGRESCFIYHLSRRLLKRSQRVACSAATASCVPLLSNLFAVQVIQRNRAPRGNSPGTNCPLAHPRKRSMGCWPVFFRPPSLHRVVHAFTPLGFLSCEHLFEERIGVQDTLPGPLVTPGGEGLVWPVLDCHIDRARAPVTE